MKLLDGICAAGLAATFAVTSLVPAVSTPIATPKISASQTDVIRIQDGYQWKRKNSNFGNDNLRRNNGNWDGNSDGNWNNGNNRSGWYKGHRGYRYKRPGYRYYDGFWFPAGAFVAGAVIGNAIGNRNAGYYRGGGGSSHVEWCYDRYRSYRSYDNTFQPNYGQRRQCNSPFG